jgi:polar amino acid transport system substrate-binding protein
VILHSYLGTTGIGGRFIRKSTAIGIAALIVLATAVCSPAAEETPSAKDLTYITHQFPPFNFQKDNSLQGISIDLLELVWNRMGENLNRSIIEFLPWTEGYQRTLNEKNTVLFVAAKLPEREQLFKWAGPVGSDTKVLLAKKDKNLTIAGPEDLKNYRIGVVKDDSAVQFVLNNGVRMEDLVVERTSKPIIEMLQNDSIDAWAYSETAGRWLIQDSGVNASDYRAAYRLGQIEAYYAFNKETPDPIVQSFQEALDSLKSNKDQFGVSDYNRILSNYSSTMQ